MRKTQGFQQFLNPEEQEVVLEVSEHKHGHTEAGLL